MASTVDHIEKTLADAYRKEIDQEENVWRSLPFFAATISFEIAAMSQVLVRLPKDGTTAWWEVFAALAASGSLIVVAIGFLAASILPAQFDYIADEPTLLLLAKRLDSTEHNLRVAEVSSFDALIVLKNELAEQYADAVHHNRTVNQRRVFRRALAGLAILIAAVINILLVLGVMSLYIPRSA